MLRFDDEAARRLEAMYLTPDVVEQRQWTRKLLALRPGHAVLDIGSGPGFLAAEMASDVGSAGHISGVDISETMLGMAQERCSRLGLGDQVDFKIGDATKLPFPDERFDAAVSTQVYEYVADIDGALAEVHRVLRPGGRVLVVDTDWDSLVWHGADPVLSARVLKAWEEHLVDAHLPGTLSLRLHRGGFKMQLHDTYTVLNPSYDPDTFSYGLIGLIKTFAPGRQGLTSQEVAAWSEELRQSGETGDYFFSLNRYLFLASKPLDSGREVDPDRS
jgi:arsenite methyltransferase